MFLVVNNNLRYYTQWMSQIVEEAMEFPHLLVTFSSKTTMQMLNGSLVVSSIDNLPDREILEISTDINCLIAWVISWTKGEQRKSHGKKTKGNLFWRPVMRPIIINAVFSCDQTLWRNQKYPPKIPFKCRITI